MTRIASHLATFLLISSTIHTVLSVLTGLIVFRSRMVNINSACHFNLCRRLYSGHQPFAGTDSLGSADIVMD
jgi:hypothetical protein